MNAPLALTLFGSFFALLLGGMPIAVSLGLASLVSVLFFNLGGLQILPQLLTSATNSWTLLAIPFFILAGSVIGETELSKRLIRLAETIIGNVPGGLAIVTVAVSIFFSGISGSGAADVAVLGALLIPAMIKAGYPRPFAAGLMATSGGVGPIIPPSIAMVIYGVVAQNVSIGKLFVAGMIPGVVFGGALALTAFVISRRNGYRGSRPRGSIREIAVAFREAGWGLLAPLIILGGIYGGVFTATESAAVAVIYGLFVGLFVYRDLNGPKLWAVLRESAVSTSTVMLIVAAASLFGYVLTAGQLAAGLGQALVGLAGSKWALLFIVNLVLLVAGMFLDAISIFYIFIPIFLPPLVSLGVDPLHFGIIAVVNVAIGAVTPPVGVNLFVAAPIARLGLAEVSAGALPFLGAAIAALIVITLVPELSLWLPSLMSR